MYYSISASGFALRVLCFRIASYPARLEISGIECCLLIFRTLANWDREVECATVTFDTFRPYFPVVSFNDMPKEGSSSTIKIFAGILVTIIQASIYVAGTRRVRRGLSLQKGEAKVLARFVLS